MMDLASVSDRQPGERNPKLETRNPKQYRNLKIRISKPNLPRFGFVLSFWYFGFVSDFEFRISDLMATSG
jgi:hypothetical protein